MAKHWQAEPRRYELMKNMKNTRRNLCWEINRFWYDYGMKEAPEFSFENALDAAEREVPHERMQEKIGWYRQEIGKFLEPPYIFDLPKTKDRLPDHYPYSYYMCRNGNRTAAAGFIEELLTDHDVALSADQRAALQNDHDFIFSLDRDTWRTAEEMEHIKFALDDAYRIISSL